VYNPWTGTWNFYGTFIDDNCPPGIVVPSGPLTDTFYVVQSGTSFVAQVASLGSGVTFTGTMDSDGGFTIEGSWTYVGDTSGCVLTANLVVSPVGGVIYASDPSTEAILTDCPTYSCTAVYSGTVSN
jgi:hypothetical protein